MSVQIDINPNIREIPFGTRLLIGQAARKKGDVVSLSAGMPNLPMPPYITQRLLEGLESGYAPYTHYFGYPELREKLAQHLKVGYGIEADPEEELLITHGVQEGLYVAMRSLLLPGDEVLMPSPHYGEYYMNTIACGCEPVLLRLDEEDGFLPDLDRWEKAITPKSRAIVFSNPNNPLGVTWDQGVLEGIAELAQKHNLVVLVDEIYHDFTFSGPPVSIGTFPGMKERTLTFGGFSKAFMMMGMRIGYVVAPAEVLSVIKKLHYCTVLGPSYPGQLAALAALDCPEDQLTPLYEDFKERLEMMYSRVSALPGVTCVKPQGGFYMFPNFKRFGMNSMDLALKLIDEAGVSCLPGTEFGDYGEGYFRFATCAAPEKLVEGLDRLEKWVAEFPLG
jgi:aminotransferase